MRGMEMAVFGAAVVGLAVLFFLVAFVQFTREAIRSKKEPKHLIRMTRERPSATLFVLRESPAPPKSILPGKKANGVGVVSPLNATIKHAKGSS